ncbi:MAG TPA: hypothetical protein VK181_10455, partial [Rhizobium sp.]|nr:hypothetical protein [Rhizobium sp.]
DGESWVVWPSGGGAYGTGALGLGAVEAIHFGRKEAPETPLFEALIRAGAFEGLFEAELITLFRSARKIVDPGEFGQRPSRRTRSLS